MEKNQAILIGKSRYSETSVIAHWCSPEWGLFRTMVKGALRPKSPFAGLLDLFVSAEIGIVRSKTSDLHTLTEAHCLKPRLGIRSSYPRVLTATYLVKLISLVAEPHTPLPSIHELLEKALDYLAEHSPSKALLERFELRLAEDLGLVGANGASPAQILRIIEQSSHRQLPVQRQQILDLIAHPSAPGTSS